MALRKCIQSTRNLHVIITFLRYHCLSPYFSFVFIIIVLMTLNHSRWQQIMIEKYRILSTVVHGSWFLFLLEGKLLVGDGCIMYAIKVGTNGEFDHPKVRLVAKGQIQIYGSNRENYWSQMSACYQCWLKRLVVSKLDWWQRIYPNIWLK